MGTQVEGKIEDLYFEITKANIDAATGLDKGLCPTGQALKQLDPESIWLIEPKVIHRYRKEGANRAYTVPDDLQRFRTAWSKWWIMTKLGREKGPFQGWPGEYIAEPHPYPEEHLLDNYPPKPEYFATVDGQPPF